MASATWFSFPGGSFFLRCNNVDAWKILLGTSVINLELLLEQNNVRLLYVSWECNEHWGLYYLYGNGTHYVNHSFSVNQSGENWSKKVIIIHRWANRPNIKYFWYWTSCLATQRFFIKCNCLASLPPYDHSEIIAGVFIALCSEDSLLKFLMYRQDHITCNPKIKINQQHTSV